VQLFRKENKLIALRKEAAAKELAKLPSTTDGGEVEMRELEAQEIVKYEKGYFAKAENKVSGEIQVAPESPPSV